jgi:hypothetical protein
MQYNQQPLLHPVMQTAISADGGAIPDDSAAGWFDANILPLV